MSSQRKERRAEIRHRKKLFGGRMTAEEVHSKYAFPPHAKCPCGAAPLTRIITMAPLDEMRKRNSAIEAAMVAAPELFMKQVVMLKENSSDEVGKPYMKLGVVYACKACTPAAERAAAKGPSWVVVEINRGPGPERPIVGVA